MMRSQTKFVVAVGAGFIAFILLLAIGGSLMDVLQDQPSDEPTGADAVSNGLWADMNFNMIILAVMMFAAVLGVLALVGGEFKWQ
jgi:multisubunit Na+/H+ antiporter MnhB subunit